MEILPKNITTKPGSIINPPASAGGGLKMPSLNKQNISFFENKMKESRWPIILSSIILFLIILAWAGLFFYNKSLDKRLAEADNKMSELQGRMGKVSLASISDLQKGLVMAKGLLASHIYSSNVLKLLEDLTLPNVQWTSLDFVVKEGKLLLKGRAQSYSTLAKQILILEKDKDKRILKTSTSGIGLDHDGGVSFAMEINLTKDLFYKFLKQQ